MKSLKTKRTTMKVAFTPGYNLAITGAGK